MSEFVVHRVSRSVRPSMAHRAVSIATMSMILFALEGTAVLAAAQSRAPEPRKSTPIIIRAARLIDGRGGEPMAPAMVRVDEDKITAVASSLPVPQGARQINLGDSTLLPGFIDLHTHLTAAAMFIGKTPWLKRRRPRMRCGELIGHW